MNEGLWECCLSLLWKMRPFLTGNCSTSSIPFHFPTCMLIMAFTWRWSDWAAGGSTCCP